MIIFFAIGLIFCSYCAYIVYSMWKALRDMEKEENDKEGGKK